MGNPPPTTDPDKLADRIEFLWSMARTIAPGHPRGVKKFRTIDEANLDRDEWVTRRARALREHRSETNKPGPTRKE